MITATHVPLHTIMAGYAKRHSADADLPDQIAPRTLMLRPLIRVPNRLQNVVVLQFPDNRPIEMRFIGQDPADLAIA